MIPGTSEQGYLSLTVLERSQRLNGVGRKRPEPPGFILYPGCRPKLLPHPASLWIRGNQPTFNITFSLPSFRTHSHLTHFPLLSKDSAQFSSLLPHRSDPLLAPFPQRHDPVCLHPSPCTCHHSPLPALTLQPQPCFRPQALHHTCSSSLFPHRNWSWTSILPEATPLPTLQRREGPASRWHSLPSPRCVPRELAQSPHVSNPAPTMGLPDRSLLKCQGHLPCQCSHLQFAAQPYAGNYRRTCYGRRKHAAAYAFNRDSIIRLFLKKSFCRLPIYQCLHF